MQWKNQATVCTSISLGFALLDRNIIKLVDFMHVSANNCLHRCNEWFVMVVIMTTTMCRF